MPKLYLRRVSIATRIIQHIRANSMLYRASAAVGFCALLTSWFQFTWLATFTLLFMIYLLTGGWRTIRVLYLTLPRDLRGVLLFLRFMYRLRQLNRNYATVWKCFARTVELYGDKVAFIFEDQQWTYKEVDAYTNKIANYFQSIGYKKGDTVALLLENRPELVFYWLGLSKIGVSSSLLNYNLKQAPLVHCITIVNAKGLVYSCDPAISDAVAHIKDDLKGIQLFEFGNATSTSLGAVNPEEQFVNCSEKQPIQDFEKSSDDILLYVYTSGTTGHPKACVMKHSRFFFFGVAASAMQKLGSRDVFYSVLPLYHTSAGIAGVSAVFITGATMVVRRKFSASQFWDDCVRYKATFVQYVGELCRYLLAQPVKPVDKLHSVTVAFGNGLRSEIWKDFKKRFNIPHLIEFYGATESIAGTVNLTQYPGAVGFFPVFLPSKLTGAGLFKMDEFNEELLRDSNGLCVPCKPGEIGQMAGKIDPKVTSRRFDGYINRKASQKKIACDVLTKGDHWYLSGDTLLWDELGYLFFRDRLGDTFRWHGENVSTTEVEGVFTKITGLQSVVVVGVEVPGCEGRAGLAAIEDPQGTVDVAALGKALSENLPSYSRPVFLRFTDAVDTTGTFKFQKSRLRSEGFDTTSVRDKMYYWDQKYRGYLPLTNEVHRKFQNKEMRL